MVKKPKKHTARGRKILAALREAYKCTAWVQHRYRFVRAL
jgi:hypothetical protein